MHWHSILVATLAIGTLANAHANGSIYDNPHRVSGNVLSSSKRFKLEREQLDVRLNAVDYEAKVNYFLTDSGGKKNSPAATMYFPVICGTIDEDQAQQKYVGSCIEKFQAWINDQPVQSQPLSLEEIEKNKVLHELANNINNRAQKIYGDVANEIPSKYVLFKIDIPADVTAKIFTVQYKAGYAQVKGDTSKSVHEHFEKASMIYDFSPAAAWVGKGDKELKIKLDISNLQSTLSYDKKQWPFIKNKNESTLTLRNPDFAKLPPLILSTDNGAYQTFASDMQRLKDSATEYRIKVISAAEPDSKHNNISALFDRDPNTFWCWKGKTAVLEMQLDPLVINSINDPVEKAPSYYPAWFESLVVLNGAVLNKQTFDKFGLARKLEISDMESSTGNVNEVDDLPMQTMESDKDKFKPLTTLTEGGGNLSRSFSSQMPAGFTPSMEKDRTQIKKRKILFKIIDVYKKKATDESCISEIYPIYNGG